MSNYPPTGPYQGGGTPFPDPNSGASGQPYPPAPPAFPPPSLQQSTTSNPYPSQNQNQNQPGQTGVPYPINTPYPATITNTSTTTTGPTATPSGASTNAPINASEPTPGSGLVGGAQDPKSYGMPPPPAYSSNSGQGYMGAQYQRGQYQEPIVSNANIFGQPYYQGGVHTGQPGGAIIIVTQTDPVAEAQAMAAAEAQAEADGIQCIQWVICLLLCIIFWPAAVVYCVCCMQH